jgi:hypothetical protein
VTPEGTTLYLGGFGVYVELVGAGGASPQWHEYLTVGNVIELR